MVWEFWFVNLLQAGSMYVCIFPLLLFELMVLHVPLSIPQAN